MEYPSKCEGYAAVTREASPGRHRGKTAPWNAVSCNEAYAMSRATCLALLMFYWCYHSLRYGPREFTILENERVLPGFVYSNQAVIAFSCGYSAWNSTVSAVAAVMLVYSIVSGRPLFSLPVIGYFLTEMTCDFCNIIVMIWLLLRNLQLETALPYSAILLLAILAEVWMWLGVVQLYEHRSFSNCNK